MVWYESFLVVNHITGLTGTFPAHFVAVLADSKNWLGLGQKWLFWGNAHFPPKMSPGMVLMHGSSKNILVFGVSSLIRTIFSYKVENGPKTSIFDLRFSIGSKRLVRQVFFQIIDSVIFPRSKTNRKSNKTVYVSLRQHVKNCIFWIFRNSNFQISMKFFT